MPLVRIITTITLLLPPRPFRTHPRQQLVFILKKSPITTTMVPIPCSIISHIAIALLILSPPDSSRFVAAQQPDVAPYPTNPGPYTGLIFLIFATVVIITAFLYYFIRERHRNTVGGTNSPFTRDTPAATAGFFSFLPPPRGVDPSVLATFPVYTHSEVKGLKAITTGEGEAAAPLECAVCLNAFQGDETLRLLPRCGHVFHLSCLDPWLAAHTTCPYCRAGLTDGPGPAGAGAGAGESTHVAVTVAVRSR